MKEAGKAKMIPWNPLKRFQRRSTSDEQIVDFGLSAKSSASEEKFSISSEIEERSIQAAASDVVEAPARLPPMADALSQDDVDLYAPSCSIESPFSTAIEVNLDGPSFEDFKYEIGYELTRSSKFSGFKVPVDELALSIDAIASVSKPTTSSKQIAPRLGDFDVLVEDYDTPEPSPSDKEAGNVLQDVTATFMGNTEYKEQNTSKPLAVATSPIKEKFFLPKLFSTKSDYQVAKAGPFRSCLRNALQPKSPHHCPVVPTSSNILAQEKSENSPEPNLQSTEGQSTSKISKKLSSRNAAVRCLQTAMSTELYESAGCVAAKEDMDISQSSAPVIKQSVSLFHGVRLGKELLRSTPQIAIDQKCELHESMVREHSPKNDSQDKLPGDHDAEHETNTLDIEDAAFSGSVSEYSFVEKSEEQIVNTEKNPQGQTYPIFELRQEVEGQKNLLGLEIPASEPKVIATAASTFLSSESTHRQGSHVNTALGFDSEQPKLHMTDAPTATTQDDLKVTIISSEGSEIIYSRTWCSNDEIPEQANDYQMETKTKRVKKSYFTSGFKKGGFSLRGAFSSKTFDTTDNTSEIPLVEWFQENSSGIDQSESMNSILKDSSELTNNANGIDHAESMNSMAKGSTQRMKNAICQRGSIVQRARHLFDSTAAADAADQSLKSSFIIWDGQSTEVEVVAVKPCPELGVVGRASSRDGYETAKPKFPHPFRFLQKASNPVNLHKTRRAGAESGGSGPPASGNGSFLGRQADTEKQMPPASFDSTEFHKNGLDIIHASIPGGTVTAPTAFKNSCSDLSASSSSDLDFSLCSSSRSSSESTYSASATSNDGVLFLSSFSDEMLEGHTVRRAPSDLSCDDVFGNIDDALFEKASFFDQAARQQLRLSMCSPCHLTAAHMRKSNTQKTENKQPSTGPRMTAGDQHKSTEPLPSMMDQSVSSVSSNEFSTGSHQMRESLDGDVKAFFPGQRYDDDKSLQDGQPMIQCHYIGFLGQFKLDINGAE